ncbi:MAG: hypothetical protein Q8Q35_00315 [Nanoarchaeota archaeon]|nr:hypothetical protein [Nanoarchaeota archaeon]
MKKLLTVLLLMLVFVPTVFAYSNFYGQEQYYSVTFDKEGEASVLAVFTIQDAEDLKDMKLEIPGEGIRIVSVTQEKYDYTETCYNEEIDCQWYRSYPVSYEDLSYTMTELTDSVTLDLELIELHEKEEEVKVIVYYKVESYVEETLGVYKFDFETISWEYDTSDVTVYIDVSEDLYLKGGNSEIEYKSGVATVEAMSESAVMMDRGFMPPSYGSGYSESVSALDPYETFHVEGKYADSWWHVNWYKFVVGILIGIAVVLAGVVGVKALYKKKKRLGLTVATGVGSGLVVAAMWLGVGYVIINSTQIFGYNDFIPMMLGMLTAMMSLLVFVAPSVLLGWKKGVKSGVYSFIVSALVAFLLLIVGIIVYAILAQNGSVYPIYY